jgi:hypothetical protein
MRPVGTKLRFKFPHASIHAYHQWDRSHCRVTSSSVVSSPQVKGTNHTLHHIGFLLFLIVILES